MVFALDAQLRRRHSVFEYTANPSCIFRLQVGRVSDDFVMSDSTHLREGDRLLDLHLWTEHIPPLPDSGPTFGWARKVHGRIAVSLWELARYLAVYPEFSDISAIRANLTQATSARATQLVHVMSRFGFEQMPSTETIPVSEFIHRFGENIWISLMVLAQNSNALHLESLWRSRITMVLSRARIEREYADHAPASGLPASRLSVYSVCQPRLYHGAR